jgi:DNA-binding MarR family transcriptional regulator
VNTDLYRKHQRALLSLNPAERRAMMALLSFAEESGSLQVVVDPGALAEALKLTRNAVNWHLYRLVQKEWIVRETQPGKKGPRSIQINAAKLGHGRSSTT